MQRPSLITKVCAMLLATSAACWLAASEPPASKKPYPKPTPPPPPSPVYTPSKEPAPSATEIEQAARDHDAMLARVIERALVARDAQRREVAFTFLLPELLQVDAPRVVAMVTRQEPGEARDLLIDEVARLWIARDRDAAVEWMKSLEGREQRAAVKAAATSIAAFDPPRAIYVADQFGMGQEDDFVEHLVQSWAEEDVDSATHWLDSQPAGPRTDRLRERLQRLRGRVARASPAETS